MTVERVITMKAESLISASWFYNSEEQKILFFWFLYEYALKLYDHLSASKPKALSKWKSQMTAEQLAKFCAYYAKRMRTSMLENMESGSGAITAYAEYITDYFHTSSSAEVKAIIKIGSAAWTELLESCAVCPTKCLSRIYTRCEMFERMERGD